MKQTQVCVIGGGCVGLTLALGLAQQGINVTVLDAGPKEQMLTEEFGLRVSALSLASQALLERLGAWQEINAMRLAPYGQMAVRDKDSFGRIAFESGELGLPALGHIVENSVIRLALIACLERQSKATLLFNTRYQDIHQSDDSVFITLEGGEPLLANLLVAADGANSGVRTRFNMPLTFKDYDHHALVATVKTALPHESTARQVFLPDGPLAFLPLPEANTHSIVWSTSPMRAEALKAMSSDEFNKHLTSAIDAECGLCEVQSERLSFPLKMRYANEWLKGRVVLMGDAAHTIHPLAGLGMNLGLKDAALLIELLSEQESGQASDEFASHALLRRYERTRKADAQKHIAMMQGLKTLFEGDNPVKKLLRGAGLNLVDKVEPLKQLFAAEAIGR